jgi:transcriptional regulator with XRE-family HTH domain
MPETRATDITLAVGRRVRAAREGAGLTHGDMADRLGMSKRNYLRIEAGSISLQVVTLAEIAVICDVDLGWLLEPVERAVRRCTRCKERAAVVPYRLCSGCRGVTV